jgi:transposase
MRVEPHDTLEALQAAVHRRSDADERDRVRMVVAAREGETGAAIAQRLGCADRVVRKWIRRYNQKGLAGLKDLPRSGQPRRLDPAQEEEVRARLDAGAQPRDGVCTLRGEDVRRILEAEFGARYSLSGTYALLHRLGYSSLAPRPRHPKADAAAQAEFEKNTPGDGAQRRVDASRRRDPGLGTG